jgi:hypothetical protein
MQTSHSLNLDHKADCHALRIAYTALAIQYDSRRTTATSAHYFAFFGRCCQTTNARPTERRIKPTRKIIPIGAPVFARGVPLVAAAFVPPPGSADALIPTMSLVLGGGGVVPLSDVVSVVVMLGAVVLVVVAVTDADGVPDGDGVPVGAGVPDGDGVPPLACHAVGLSKVTEVVKVPPMLLKSSRQFAVSEYSPAISVLARAAAASLKVSPKEMGNGSVLENPAELLVAIG